jgi:nitrogen-specific signal transduction histidine kinase
MAHGRQQAFDLSDCHLMEILANFAAMGVREENRRKLFLEKEKATAAAAMANELAHKINNPLQSLTNILFLAAQGYDGEQAKMVGVKASEDLSRLSELVRRLLSLPFGRDHKTVG